MRLREVRGCPALCPEGSPDTQRPLAEDDWSKLPYSVRAAIFYDSMGYICACCGEVYIRQPLLDVRLGRLDATRAVVTAAATHSSGALQD